MNFTDYIPQGVVTAVAGVAAYVFNDHKNRDDARFDKVGAALLQFNEKLDDALKAQADNHADVLKLLIERKP